MLRFLSLLCVIFFLFSAGVAVGSNAERPIVLDSQQNRLSLANHVSVLRDNSGLLNFAEILAPAQQLDFQASSNGKFNFGFNSSAIWLKFSVENPENREQHWVLEVAYPMLDDILLFEGGTGKEKRIAGDSFPFAKREEPYRNFLFNLRIGPGVTQTYYLRIHSTSSLSIPLQLWAKSAHQKRMNQEQLLLGICFGAIAMMVLYNFLLFIVLRVRMYLHYVIFIAASGLLLFTLNGLAFQYLWPNWIWWANKCPPIFIFACNASCVSFARSFLETVKDSPGFDRILRFFVFLNLLLLAVAVILPYALAIRFATVLALCAALLSLAVALPLALRLRQACFYLSAWLPLLMGILVYGMKSFGILPSSFFTEYALNIGMLLMIALLSLGVADRINTIKKERLAIQKQAYEEQKLLTRSFERFVPKRFLSLLGKESITDVRLGDHVLKDMSVLFTDIRSFTSMSERMTPQENFQFLNAYLQRVDPVVVAHNGVVDKYIGDAVMALFETADDAVEAALEMLLKLEEFNVERVQDGEEPIRVGIGINSGELMLGTIGAAGRMEGTVISDAVNLASRIEGLTKRFKTSLLVSDGCRSRLVHPERFTLKQCEEVHVRGKREAITVWEVLS